MAKIVRIRLYRVQDYDLYAIYYDKKNFRLSKMFIAAVSAFANGRPLPVFSLKNISSLPKPVKADNGEVIRGSGLKFTLIMSFSIPDYDTKTIALIDYLTKNQTANSFLKTLVRRCFTDMEYMYLDESIREQFPDPGSMVMTKMVQSYTNDEKKTVRKKKKSEPKKTPPHSDSAVNNVASHEPTPTNNGQVAADINAEAPPANKVQHSDDSKSSDSLFGSAPSYVIQNHEAAPYENTPVSNSPVGPSENSNTAPDNDLFSLVQGFEY